MTNYRRRTIDSDGRVVARITTAEAKRQRDEAIANWFFWASVGAAGWLIALAGIAIVYTVVAT